MCSSAEPPAYRKYPWWRPRKRPLVGGQQDRQRERIARTGRSIYWQVAISKSADQRRSAQAPLCSVLSFEGRAGPTFLMIERFFDFVLMGSSVTTSQAPRYGESAFSLWWRNAGPLGMASTRGPKTLTRKRREKKKRKGREATPSTGGSPTSQRSTTGSEFSFFFCWQLGLVGPRLTFVEVFS